jgi:hypothetical protein
LLRFGPGRAWYAGALALWIGGFAVALAGGLAAQADADAAGQAYRRSAPGGAVRFAGSADRPCLYVEEPAAHLSSMAELRKRTVVVVDQASGYRSPVAVTGKGPAYVARVGGVRVVGRPAACWVPERGAFTARLQGGGGADGGRKGGGALAVGPRPAWTPVQRAAIVGGLAGALSAVLLAGLVRLLRGQARRRSARALAPDAPPGWGERPDPPARRTLLVTAAVLAEVAAAGWLAATQAEFLARSSPLRSLFVATGDSPARAGLAVITLALIPALLAAPGRTLPRRVLTAAALLAAPTLTWLALSAAHTLVLR